MSCPDEGNECQFDEQAYCPKCHEPTGFWCVNCGDYYDGGASNFYGECSCIRKLNAPNTASTSISVEAPDPVKSGRMTSSKTPTGRL